MTISLTFSHHTTTSFEWLDSSNDGSLDFAEFLNSISTFCMFGDTELVQQAFTIIDVDGRGYMLEDEFEDLLDMVHGSNPLPETTVQKALDAFEHGDGRITYPQLSNLHRRQPRLLTPILNFQAGIRKTFLGVKFWEGKLDLYVKTRERMKKELTDKDKKAGEALKKARRKKELAEGTATKTWMEIIDEQREKGVIGIYKDVRRTAEDTYASVHATVTDRDFDAKEFALDIMKGVAKGEKEGIFMISIKINEDTAEGEIFMISGRRYLYLQQKQQDEDLSSCSFSKNFSLLFRHELYDS